MDKTKKEIQTTLKEIQKNLNLYFLRLYLIIEIRF